MTGMISISKSPLSDNAGEAGVDVTLFDPPMCCPTGLCGPSLDQTLLDVNEMIMALEESGIRVERYQMTSQPHKFMSNDDVMRLVRERQMSALPITIVYDRVVKVGAYPTLDEVQTALAGAANR